MSFTDKYGSASLGAWFIDNGPQGIYSIYYSTSEGVRTRPYKLSFATQVASIVPLNTPPFNAQKYGVPLAVQPRVKVLDINGNPVEGKIVTAVSWPEPYVNAPQGLNYKIEGMVSP